jgi:hypothetical protein
MREKEMEGNIWREGIAWCSPVSGGLGSGEFRGDDTGDDGGRTEVR